MAVAIVRSRLWRRRRSIGGPTGSERTQTVAVDGKPTGELTISNWPLYIDKQDRSPTSRTPRASRVKYIEDVNDNAEFFGKMQPLLDQGESGGRSIFVVTDWMANKMHELGYLQNLDKTAMPNVEKNLVPSLAAPVRSTRTATSRCRGRAG